MNKFKNPKTNVTIVQYTRSTAGLSQIPRKTWNFYGCVPTDISNREYTYQGGEDLKSFNTTWVYDKYDVNSNLYLSVKELIKSFNPFRF